MMATLLVKKIKIIFILPLNKCKKRLGCYIIGLNCLKRLTKENFVDIILTYYNGWE